MSVNSVILGHLTKIMQQHGSKLLFAGESGSRAWGLQAPDSDYDVRCIYVYPALWYLAIEDRQEIIETVFPDDIDIAGYELRKALRLFSACNIPLNEQIQNPAYYSGDPVFIARLRELIPFYFNKKRALFHYTGIAGQMMPQIQGLSIGLHRVFYLIRPLLACEWIEKHNSMPPTEFQKLLDADYIPLTLKSEVTEIMQRKIMTVMGNRETFQLSRELLYWLTEALQQHQKTMQFLPPNSAPPQFEPLNELFRTCIEYAN